MKTAFKQIVEKTLVFESQLLLRRHRPMIIAVTGSVGKTTTKDAIYTVLKDHVHTRKSQKSHNSDIGVSLSVLGLPNAGNNPWHWIRNLFDGLITAAFSRRYPAVLVLEMAVDRPGDMRRLTQWVRPDIAVLTRFPEVPVHVEYFASPQAVVDEKMELVKALADDGVVIYNHDDEIIRTALQSVRQQTIGFSRFVPSQFTVGDDSIRYEKGKAVGLQASITHVDETASLCIEGALGTPPLYAAAAAVAVGVQSGMTLDAAVNALQAHRVPAGRLRLLPGCNDSLIIDDTCNASPAAMEQALLALYELTGDGKKIAVLGDMLELGQFSVSAHEKIGEQVAGVADVLVTLGMRARGIARTALEHGLSEKQVFQYDVIERAAAELKAIVEPGDIILVKASQGIRAERIVKELLKDSHRAPELLVRQEKIWQRR